MDVDGVGDSEDMRNRESRGLGGDRRKRSHSQPRILVSNYKIGIILQILRPMFPDRRRAVLPNRRRQTYRYSMHPL